MTSATRIYTQIIPANAVDILNVAGGFYKVLETTGDIEISRQGGNAIGPIRAGQGERAQFSTLIVRNLTATQVTARILIADESFEDTRIYGNVDVVDGGRVITMANQSFAGWVTQNAVAGEFAHLQLFNPVGRTQNIAISKLHLFTVATCNIQLRWFATPLTTLWSSPNNKRFGGANSTAELRQQSNVAVLGNGANINTAMLANTPVQIDFKEPVVLEPGMGLVAANVTANAFLSLSVDFYEFSRS